MSPLATDTAFETRTAGQNQCKDVLPTRDAEVTLKKTETALETRGEGEKGENLN